jgi:hypothetical protein
MECAYGPCRNIVAGRPNKRFCSPNCKNKHHVTMHRRRTKRRAVELLGGRCVRCGYDKCDKALNFHHPDDNKAFGISEASCGSWDRLVEELSKCVLLCANCHAEVHDVDH